VGGCVVQVNAINLDIFAVSTLGEVQTEQALLTNEIISHSTLKTTLSPTSFEPTELAENLKLGTL
jgi:hypothetical protein